MLAGREGLELLAVVEVHDWVALYHTMLLLPPRMIFCGKR